MVDLGDGHLLRLLALLDVPVPCSFLDGRGGHRRLGVVKAGGAAEQRRKEARNNRRKDGRCGRIRVGVDILLPSLVMISSHHAVVGYVSATRVVPKQRQDPRSHRDRIDAREPRRRWVSGREM